MRCRALLTSIAAGVSAAAGCLSGRTTTPSPDSGRESPSAPASTVSPSTTPVSVRSGSSGAPSIDVPTGVESSRDAPAETFVFGRASARPPDVEPRHVVLWNATPTAADVSVTVTDAHGDGPRLDRTLSLAPDAHARLHLLEPAPYRVDLTVGDTAESLTRDPADFDCNVHATRVRLTGASIETQTVSTAVGCR